MGKERTTETESLTYSIVEKSDFDKIYFDFLIDFNIIYVMLNKNKDK